MSCEYTDAIRTQRLRPYIYGAVVYEEFVSGKSHITRFCYTLWGNPAVTGASGMSYSMCGGNSNCADEECDDKAGSRHQK